MQMHLDQKQMYLNQMQMYLNQMQMHLDQLQMLFYNPVFLRSASDILLTYFVTIINKKKNQYSN